MPGMAQLLIINLNQESIMRNAKSDELANDINFTYQILQKTPDEFMNQLPNALDIRPLEYIEDFDDEYAYFLLAVDGGLYEVFYYSSTNRWSCKC